MARLNINDKVTVTLSKAGANVYNDHSKHRPTTLQEGDQLELQLWEIMAIFGNGICWGCDSPFKGDIVV